MWTRAPRGAKPFCTNIWQYVLKLNMHKTMSSWSCMLQNNFSVFVFFNLTYSQKVDITVNMRVWIFLHGNRWATYRPIACSALSVFIMHYHMVVCNHLSVVTGRYTTLFPQWVQLVNPSGMGPLICLLIRVSLFLPVFHSVLNKYQIWLFLKSLFFKACWIEILCL